VDADLIPANPADKVTSRLGLRQRKQAKIQALNREEVQLFLDICAEHYPDFYPFFLCGFRTGMRLGELLALEWGDVDWNGQFIQVSRSYKLGRTTETKTKKWRRVDASDQLLDALRELHLAEKRNALKSGHPLPELIFHRGGRNID
jgi:integrase